MESRRKRCEKMSHPWFSEEGSSRQHKTPCPGSDVKSFIELTETSQQAHETSTITIPGRRHLSL